MKTTVNTPLVDIVECDSEYVLYLDMPGVKKDDLAIEVERNTLSIKGNYQQDEEKSTFGYQEFRAGNYARSFKLAANVDHSGIKANLEDGVLTLRLQKATETQPKKILIN
jgi:HSP20 family protein